MQSNQAKQANNIVLTAPPGQQATVLPNRQLPPPSTPQVQAGIRMSNNPPPPYSSSSNNNNNLQTQNAFKIFSSN